MPLVFPIAPDARSALSAAATARTQTEAGERAGHPVALASEWLRPNASERETLKADLDRGVSSGFVQIYEDDKGRPVIAITFWKPKQDSAARSAPSEIAEEPRSELAPAQVGPAPPIRRSAPAGRKPKKRHRVADNRQLDLFAGPDQAGHEAPDPHNPLVVLVEEEGVGAAFGMATPPAPRASPRKTRKR